MKSITAIIIALFLLIGTVPYVYGEGVRLDGRIFEEKSQKGIANLIVKLISPKASGKPEKITTVDPEGEFSFSNIPTGRYLLEAYQGVTILSRTLIDVDRDMRVDIQLRRKN